jgi:hypothetical protein
MRIHAFRYDQLIKYFFIGVLLICTALSSEAQDNLVVIGNQTGVPADLNMSDLKAVFRGERQRWSNGTKVVIAMIKSTTPLGNEISQKIYSMNGDEVRGFWAGLSFAGKSDPPNVFNTAAEVEVFVSQNPGAIAILDKTTNATDTKTILVGGKKTF